MEVVGRRGRYQWRWWGGEGGISGGGGEGRYQWRWWGGEGTGGISGGSGEGRGGIGISGGVGINGGRGISGGGSISGGGGEGRDYKQLTCYTRGSPCPHSHGCGVVKQ